MEEKETKIAGGHVYKVEQITLEQELESINGELVVLKAEIDNAQSVVDAWTARMNVGLARKQQLLDEKVVLEEELAIQNSPVVEEPVITEEVPVEEQQ